MIDWPGPYHVSPLVPGNEVDPFKSCELEPERMLEDVGMLLLEEHRLGDKMESTTIHLQMCTATVTIHRICP